MRSPRGRLALFAAGAMALTAAIWGIALLGGITFNPAWLFVLIASLAAMAWLTNQGGEPPPTVSWPRPRTLAATTQDVHERGLTQAMTMFASAESGSKLSGQDVATALTDATARKLVLRGADPDDPFAAADSQLSPQLLGLCRATQAQTPAPRLSRRRLDAYLKEILAL